MDKRPYHEWLLWPNLVHWYALDSVQPLIRDVHETYLKSCKRKERRKKVKQMNNNHNNITYFECKSNSYANVSSFMKICFCFYFLVISMNATSNYKFALNVLLKTGIFKMNRRMQLLFCHCTKKKIKIGLHEESKRTYTQQSTALTVKKAPRRYIKKGNTLEIMHVQHYYVCLSRNRTPNYLYIACLKQSLNETFHRFLFGPKQIQEHFLFSLVPSFVWCVFVFIMKSDHRINYDSLRPLSCLYLQCWRWGLAICSLSTLFFFELLFFISVIKFGEGFRRNKMSFLLEASFFFVSLNWTIKWHKISFKSNTNQTRIEKKSIKSKVN